MSILRCGDTQLCTDVTPLTNTDGIWRIDYLQQYSQVPFVSAWVIGRPFEPVVIGLAIPTPATTVNWTMAYPADDYPHWPMTPVPEPSYAPLLALLACTVAALWLQGRRKAEPSGSCRCECDHTDGTGICWVCGKTRV